MTNLSKNSMLKALMSMTKVGKVVQVRIKTERMALIVCYLCHLFPCSKRVEGQRTRLDDCASLLLLTISYAIGLQ